MSTQFIVLSAAALLWRGARDGTRHRAVTAPVQAGAPTTPATEADEHSHQRRAERSKRRARSNGPEKPAEKAAKKQAGRRGFRWTDRPSLRLGSRYAHRLPRALQGDSTLRPPRWTSMMVTARVWTSRAGGSVWTARFVNIIDYQVEGELGVDHNPWRDVYANYKQYGFAKCRRASSSCRSASTRTTSATNLDFVYRSRVAALLAPGRDWGVMAHGRLLAPRLAEIRAGRLQRGRR